MTSSPSMGVVLQMLDQNHQAAEKGHARLREDFRDMELTIETLQKEAIALNLRVRIAEDAAKQPMNVSKFSFSTWQLIAVVGFCASLVTGWLTLTIGQTNFSNTLETSLTTMSAKIDAISVKVDTAAKLQDERYTTQIEANRLMAAELQMRRVEIQNLSNLVQGKR